jgi:hypothetical protein
MLRTPVASSNLLSVGYVAATRTLEIEFRSGGIYKYNGVPVKEYNAFIAAPSQGKYFLAYIKDRYSTTQVR